MINLLQYSVRRTSLSFLTMLTLCVFASTFAHAQSINVCTSQGYTDGGNELDETICLYGDSSSLAGEADISSSTYSMVAGDLYLYQGTSPTPVASVPFNYSPTYTNYYEVHLPSTVPVVNNTYTLTGNAYGGPSEGDYDDWHWFASPAVYATVTP